MYSTQGLYKYCKVYLYIYYILCVCVCGYVCMDVCVVILHVSYLNTIYVCSIVEQIETDRNFSTSRYVPEDKYNI